MEGQVATGQQPRGLLALDIYHVQYAQHRVLAVVMSFPDVRWLTEQPAGCMYALRWTDCRIGCPALLCVLLAELSCWETRKQN